MDPRAKLQILLVANYLPDGQKSMLRFAEQLKQGLNENDVEVEIYQPRVVAGRILSGTTGLGKWMGYIDKYLIAPIDLRRRVRSMPKHHTVVHICDHSNAIYTKALKHTPHLVTCHDLLAVRSALGEITANKPKWTGRQQQAMILRGLKRSRMIVSVSQATLDDVERLVGSRQEWLHSIPNSLDTAFIEEAGLDLKPSPRPEALPFDANTKYVMHIGGEKWYKNRKGVLQIYLQLTKEMPDLHLVIVGPSFSESVLKEVGCTQLKNRIHYLNGITDAVLRQVYRACEMLLFPSRMEGFGWPILEAQASGCPVLTAAIEPMQSLNAVPQLAVKVDLDTFDYATKMAQAALQVMHLPSDAKRSLAQQSKDFSARFTNQASVTAYLHLYQHLTQAEPSQ